MTLKRRRNRSGHSRDGERRFTVRGVRRDPLDIGKLSKALLSLAMAEAEREAQAEHASQTDKDVESTVASDQDQQPGGEDNDPR